MCMCAIRTFPRLGESNCPGVGIEFVKESFDEVIIFGKFNSNSNVVLYPQWDSFGG